MKTNTRLGVTPVNMRLAYAHMMKGVGIYRSTHPFYDFIEVSETIPWGALPDGGQAGVTHGATLRVTFYRHGDVVRHIDFALLCTGGGGEPAITLIES
jgi:hypothetical protein